MVFNETLTCVYDYGVVMLLQDPKFQRSYYPLVFKMLMIFFLFSAIN